MAQFFEAFDIDGVCFPAGAVQPGSRIVFLRPFAWDTASPAFPRRGRLNAGSAVFIGYFMLKIRLFIKVRKLDLKDAFLYNEGNVAPF